MDNNRFTVILLIIMMGIFANCQSVKKASVGEVAEKIDHLSTNRYIKLMKHGWKDFYRMYFYESAFEDTSLPAYKRQAKTGILKGPDFSGIDSLNLPMIKEGQYYLIFIKGLRVEDVIRTMRYDFAVTSDSSCNLDNLSLYSIRETDRDYAIMMKNQKEVDETLEEAATASEQKASGMTLLEYLILELRYHDEYQRHLPPSICCGSRDSYGRVPEVSWNEEEKALTIRMVAFNPCDKQPVRVVYGKY